VTATRFGAFHATSNVAFIT